MHQAGNANTTSTPIVDLTTPRKQVEDALYEVGVITDIIRKLTTIMISTDDQVCGTSYSSQYLRMQCGSNGLRCFRP